ncbi:AsmA family protein [Allopusillimonas ginsengisoli]|uniref:AsmA family protein n=1 Tax=Allopusillimonas ginsengisoli TaxID=453575 RepID=UPI001020A4DF|nr:AsmA family protein [Allopusillimonas ginsengisoli]TEA78194.1 AsmA family protein [Allopusillimonas ginsengisoli]
MPRYLKITLWVLFCLVASAVLAFVLLATFNWNHAKPWINRQATELAGRQVEVRGDLDVQWQRSGEAAQGWRGWIPWPRITASDLVIGNSQWSTADRNMAQVSRLSAVINPVALLGHTVQLAELDIDKADIFLERNQKGDANWTFERADEQQTPPSDWTFDLQQLTLNSVKAQVVDAASKLDVTTQLDTLRDRAGDSAATTTGKAATKADSPAGENSSAAGQRSAPPAQDAPSPEYGIGWKASGTYNEADVDGQGRMGGILSLREGSKPFPLQGTLGIGKTSVELEGSVTRPQSLAALDVNMKLSGDSMSDLLPLIGVALPVTPPYATEGRLSAALEGDVDVWRYQNFKGRVGESDLEGSIEFRRSKPRPKLTGSLTSHLLTFKDLGPLIGADTSDVKSDAASKEGKAQPKGRVLPVSPINTDAWGAMDAQIHFKGEKIIRDKDLPLDNIDAQVKLENKVLTFTPLNFGVAGGTMANVITLDGSGKQITAKLKTEARHLQLKKLFPGAESMNASFGELHGDAQLAGHGESIAQMLGTADGQLSAVVSRGTISHFLLEAAGLNVANMIMLKLFGDEQIVLNCMASDFGVKNGIATVRTFRLETDDTTVDMSGQINLRNETINLEVRPENKTVRIFTLRSPLYAKGTLANPDVGVEKGPLAVRAGAAVALGIVATPFAALLPLLNVGSNDETGCQSLRASPAKTEGKGGAQANDKSAREQQQEKERKERESWPSSQAKP